MFFYIMSRQLIVAALSRVGAELRQQVCIQSYMLCSCKSSTDSSSFSLSLSLSLSALRYEKNNKATTRRATAVERRRARARIDALRRNFVEHATPGAVANLVVDGRDIVVGGNGVNSPSSTNVVGSVATNVGGVALRVETLRASRLGPMRGAERTRVCVVDGARAGQLVRCCFFFLRLV